MRMYWWLMILVSPCVGLGMIYALVRVISVAWHKGKQDKEKQHAN
jgi:hypothetical protein